MWTGEGLRIARLRDPREVKGERYRKRGFMVCRGSGQALKATRVRIPSSGSFPNSLRYFGQVRTLFPSPLFEV